MNLKVLTIFLFLLFTLSACNNNPDLSSPKHYEKQGINFDYPGNWEISEDQITNDIHYIAITGAGNSVFLIHVYPSEIAPDLMEFAKFFSSTSAGEMPFGEMKTDSITAMKEKNDSTWVKEMLSINLLGQSIPYTREYRKMISANKETFLTSQASIKNQKNVNPGFQLITHSFSLN